MADAPDDRAADVPSEVASAARLWAKTTVADPPPNAAWIEGFVWRTLWKGAAVGLVVALAVLTIIQVRNLLGMLVVALFFALAIVPGVNSLVKRFGMKRGAAVGIVFAGAVVVVTVMVLVLIPAIVQFAEAVQENASAWFTDLNSWTEGTFGGAAVDADAAAERTADAAAWLASWADNVLGLVASGIGIVFDLFTIAAFTFYFAADFPKLRRAVMSRMTPERQRVFAWITDTSIEQTGGYFYSRLLLMIVNGSLAFVVMMLVGLPLVYSLPLALFMGFVSEFIPFIGTYIGAAIPIAVIWAVEGLAQAFIMLAWVIIYQQIENYVLSPRFSAKTMELNGAVAFGGAIAGGAIAGPMGAFMALPICALLTAIAKNAGKTYAVVIEDLDGPDLSPDGSPEQDEPSKLKTLVSRLRPSRDADA